MTIKFSPSEMIKKFSRENIISRVIGKDLKINRAVLKMIASTGIVTEEKLEEMALKVIKQYKESIKDKVSEGESKIEAKEEVLNKKKLLINRVKNLVVSEISVEIKKIYKGDKYVWLPSTAITPDPLHQLKYGKIFIVGQGEMPQDRYGCQCGMLVLTEDDLLYSKQISSNGDRTKLIDDSY